MGLLPLVFAAKKSTMSLALMVLMSTRLGEIHAAPAEHRVDWLPGWDSELPSQMYSGYIDAGSDCQESSCYSMKEHYIFVESENDPTKDPVVLWTNGGPGASSLYGLFVELGPFFLSDKSLTTEYHNLTGVPSLFRNRYGWSRFANLLIINSPPPVGFSYCDPVGPTGDGYSCGYWNDTRTAKHNLNFLKNWFKVRSLATIERMQATCFRSRFIYALVSCMSRH